MRIDNSGPSGPRRGYEKGGLFDGIRLTSIFFFVVSQDGKEMGAVGRREIERDARLVRRGGRGG